MFTLLIISLYAVSFDSVHTLKGDAPYYVRSKPVEFRVELPQDFIIRDNNIPLVHTFTCNISIEPIISSFEPYITWRYNGSSINKTNTPEMNVTVTGDAQILSQLTTVYPGTYQCVVDDGYFVTVSREARLAFKGEPNITVMIADIPPDIEVAYYETSQTKSTYELECPNGLSGNKESSNSSNSTLTTWTWFVNGNKHHVRDRVLTIRSGSDVLDVVGIYQCFVQNNTHEISRVYRLIAADLPNPGANMVFNVLKNFSQFNLIYVNISWDIDKNPHIKEQTFLRQSLEIIVDDDLCYNLLYHDIDSTLVMLQTHYRYKIRIVSGFYSGKCSESYYYMFQWPNHTKGMILKEDMFNCSKFYDKTHCKYSQVELVENGDIAQPKCKYNGDKLDCNFTWAANSSYEKDLKVICPGQKIEEDIVKNEEDNYKPIGISVEHSIQCGSSCNLTIHPKNPQSIQNIVKRFDFIKPKAPVVQKAYWKYVNGHVRLSLDLNITDPQVTCGSIRNCTLYGNEDILTSNWNCSALNLAENLFHIVWRSDYDQRYLKAVNVSVSYTSVGGESQRSNTIEVFPLLPCPPPSLSPNTMVLTTLPTTVLPGTNITIGCVGGYYTDQEEILTCGSDGQWRGNIIQCRADPENLRSHKGYLALTTLLIIPMVIGFAVVLGVILYFRHSHKERTEIAKMKKDNMDQESDIQSTIHDDMTDYDCCLKADEHGDYQSPSAASV